MAMRDWYPIESSPEVLTALARCFGLPERYAFIDIPSLDPDDFDALLHPSERQALATILLFPDTPGIVAKRTAEGPGEVGKENAPLWIPQRGVGHSCGTFATIHALAATRLAPDLEPFFAECEATEPSARAALVASSSLIRDAHNSVVTAGQTKLRENDWTDCDHFLAFVRHNGRIYEMDGNAPREAPLDRGACGDILADTARVIREVYLPHAGDSLNFSLIALVDRASGAEDL